MSHTAIFLWLLNVVIDTVGHLVFKAAASQGLELDVVQHWKHMLARPLLWIGAACYVCEFFVWLAFLSLVPLSSGVMLGSINIVVLMIAGRLLFKERLTPWRVAGMLLITLGVIFVGVGE